MSSEVKLSCLQGALDEEKSRNEILTSSNQGHQKALESARIELAQHQGVLETQKAQSLALAKVNSELESRIELLEEKLQKQEL
ncbi:hypothetical protein AB4344_11725 [Vibrio breoganii]